MELGSNTWTDAEVADAALAILPVGSTEQHGPHAPLATDTVIAEAVALAGADAFAETTGDEVVIAPPLPVGISEEHRAFSGSLWLSPDTFRAAVRDVVRSLIHHGWRRVVVVNGHGGNVNALRELGAELTRESGAYVTSFTWFRAVDFAGVDVDIEAFQMGHAGAAETALLRAIDPALVREDRVDDARADAADRWGEWVSGVNLAYDSRDFSENGVVGDPSVGDATLGQQLLDEAAAALAELLVAVADWRLD